MNLPYQHYVYTNITTVDQLLSLKEGNYCEHGHSATYTSSCLLGFDIGELRLSEVLDFLSPLG